MAKAINISQQKFGRLTAVKFHHKNKKHHWWVFKCSCGNEIIHRKGDVVCGLLKSCGCFKKEIAKKLNYIHGLSGTRFYDIWIGILARTNNPNSTGYRYYGKKGIKNLWNNFIEFRKDMYKSYLQHCTKFGEKQTTIDRINVYGNYYKKNCRWVTWKEQQHNKR